MAKRLLLVSILAVSYLWGFGQNSIFSPYSAYGLGQLSNPAFSRSLGMGSVGIATFDRFTVNRINPASYSDLVINSVEVLGTFSKSNLSSATQQAKYNGGGVQAISFGFKPNKGPSFGFGLAPYSTVGYDIRAIANTDTNNVFAAQSVAEGGISEFYGGLGAKFFKKHLSVGFNLGYLFGTQTYRDSTYLNDEDFATGALRTQNRTGGFNYKFGISYTDTLRGGSQYRIGATIGGVENLKLDTKTSYDYRIFVPGYIGELVFTYITVDSIKIDTIGGYRAPFDSIATVVLNDRGGSKVTVPIEFGFGVGWEKPGKYSVAADFFFSRWSNYKSESSNQNLQKLKDSYRVNIGGEWIPKAGSSKFLEVLTYRAGIRYEKTYLYLRDKNINVIGGSIGLGIPLRRTFSMLNLSVEYTARGTTANGLIRESSILFGMGLNFNEQWFIKRKYD